MKFVPLLFVLVISVQTKLISQEFISDTSGYIVREDSSTIVIDKDSIFNDKQFDFIIDSLINFAEKYIGAAYRFGGNTRQGFDCSGFVGYIFSEFGVELPRSSREQGLIGVGVDKNNIKRGDLVFFKGRNVHSPVIGHVGLVVDTAGHRIRFIHASRGKGVTCDFLDADYYRNRFVGAKRIFDSVYVDSLGLIFIIPEFNPVSLQSDNPSNNNEVKLLNVTEDVDSNDTEDVENDIRPKQIHVVKRGETLFAISKKYDTSVETVKLLNSLRNDRIYVGQKLIVAE